MMDGIKSVAIGISKRHEVKISKTGEIELIMDIRDDMESAACHDRDQGSTQCQKN